MMNDDNRNDNTPKDNENAKTAQEETGTGSDGDKKMGKVIPFDSISPTNEEVVRQVNSEVLEPAKAAATDAAQSLKAAFEDFKKQLAPLKDSLKEISAALKSGAKDAAKELEKSNGEAAEAGQGEAAADEAQSEKDKENADAAAAAAREAGQLVTLGLDKIKSQVSKAKFDFKGAVEREFANYADANLKEDEYTVGEDGRKVVKVDGKFMQQHANEVIPALIRGTVGSFFKAVLGEDLIKVAEDKEKSAEAGDAENADNAGDDKARGLKGDGDEVEAEPSKYKVEFDFSRALGDAIRNAEVAPAPASDEARKDRAVGREILIEGAKIVEDALNGKSAEDAKERLEDAVDRAKQPDAEKSPEDIQAVDEKHRKILELSKQFEKNMNPDK